ncbi:Uma2 family endonuclease [Tumidithrix elongata RA019]|uniref:Uma2 family endonuclease n=1 Tax=Tumidithrix elongata BACA0141 TaxID=2716417 RepID=A0AAW9Q5W1_9CYAN|nr:Uma2 family endonuclease [Tumidithrix elongata RA019]
MTQAPVFSFEPINPWSDEPQMESIQHLDQMMLLLTCLRWHWRDRNDYFAAGNLTIFYSPRQRKSEDFRGPDFFLVKDCDPDMTRRSWVVWQEGGRYPDLIVEILSDSTAKTDLGLKKQIYQDIFRTPEYFLFEPHTFWFEGYQLVVGQYEPIVANAEGRLWSQELQLFLGVHEGQVRFFMPSGDLVLTPQESALLVAEQAEQAQQEAKLAQQEAEAERKQREKLAAKLRELNIDPDSL